LSASAVSLHCEPSHQLEDGAVRGGYRSLGTSAHYVQPSRAHLTSFHLFMGLYPKMEGNRKKPIKKLAMAFGYIPLSVIFRDHMTLVKLLVFPNDIRVIARRPAASARGAAGPRPFRPPPLDPPAVYHTSHLPFTHNHSSHTRLHRTTASERSESSYGNPIGASSVLSSDLCGEISNRSRGDDS
jgi:hypothetical protein